VTTEVPKLTTGAVVLEVGIVHNLNVRFRSTQGHLNQITGAGEDFGMEKLHWFSLIDPHANVVRVGFLYFFFVGRCSVSVVRGWV
jgi:hypothetical protein